MRTWTEEETSILIDNYNKVSNRELKQLLPLKSDQGIYKKAYKIGLRKTKEIEFINRSKAHSGQNSSNWKGGVMTNRRGYRLVKCPGHHRADARGYVMEHILIWEKATGIEVPQGCCVHHLNGDKGDNRIENLCLMERGAHTAHHHRGAIRAQETRNKISMKRRERAC